MAAEMIDEASSLESTTVGVSRTSATIKGGRRFSFNALVVVGDRRGRIGLGYGKAKEVPAAVEKAQRDAKKRLSRVELLGGTIPHAVTARFGASGVTLIPASPGTGVVAGQTVRAVLDMVGVTDCLTKCYGSTNHQNTVKAALSALGKLRSREAIAKLRGITLDPSEVELMVERGKKFMPATREKTMKAPVSLMKKEMGRGGRGGGRGGGGGGGGRGRRPDHAPAAPEAPAGGAPDAAPSGEGTPA